MYFDSIGRKMHCFKCGQELKADNCECSFSLRNNSVITLSELNPKEMEEITEILTANKESVSRGENELLVESEKKTPSIEDGTISTPQEPETSFISAFSSEPNISPTERKPTPSLPGSRRSMQWVALAGVSLVTLLCLVFGLKDMVFYHDAPVFGSDGYQVARSYAAGWFDSIGGRQGYTVDEVNAGLLGDTITINSITDGKIGHEFNFVAAADGTTLRTEQVWKSNALKAEEGYIYQVRLYYENTSVSAAAEGVAVRFDVCDTVYITGDDEASPLEGLDAEGYYVAPIHGYISSTNATPDTIGDSVKFYSDRPFHLEYKLGTACLKNTSNGSGNGYALPDEIVGSWVSIGYDEMDGVLPAGYEYDGQCVIVVEPVFEDEPVNKFDTFLVRRIGSRDWNKTLETKEGDTIELQYHFVNYESLFWTNTSIHLELPSGISYLNGSAKLYTPGFPEGVKVENDDIVENGLFFGDEYPTTEAYLRFQVAVDSISEDLEVTAQSRLPGEFITDTVTITPIRK